MRTIVLLLAASISWASATLQINKPSNTEVLIDILLTAPTGSACIVEASTFSDFSVLLHDIDSTLFTNANLTTRGNGSGIDSLRHQHIKLGTRGGAQAGLDGFLYSRALPAADTVYVRVNNTSECDSGGAVTGSVVMSTVPFGNTYNDFIPALSNTGRTAFPDIRNGETVYDPQTGVKVMELTRPGDMISSTVSAQSFLGPYDTTGGWICTAGALPCSTTGGASPLVLSLDLAPYQGASYETTNSVYLDYIRANITATSSSSSAARGCFTVNNGGGICATQTISQTLSVGSTTKNYGDHTNGMGIWRPFLVAPERVLISKHVEDVTINRSTKVVTYVDSPVGVSHQQFRPSWGAGTVVNLVGSGCSGNFVMASFTSDATLTLTTDPGCTSAVMTVYPFAFLLFSVGQVTVTAATYDAQTDFAGQIDSSAMQDGTNSMGGPAITVGTNTGYASYNTEAFYWVSGAQGGKRNLIGQVSIPNIGAGYPTTVFPATPNVCGFDPVTPGVWTCGVGMFGGDTGLVKLTYSGTYAGNAQGTLVSTCGSPPCVTQQFLETALVAKAIAYSPAFAASCCAHTATVYGANSDGTLQIQFLDASQGYSGWEAVYSIALGNYIAIRDTRDIGAAIHSLIPLHGSSVGYGSQMDFIAGGNPGPLSGPDTTPAAGPYRVIVPGGISGTRGACPAWSANAYIPAAWWPGGTLNTATNSCVTVTLSKAMLEDPSPYQVSRAITINNGSTTVTFTGGDAIPLYAGKQIVISGVTYTFVAGASGYANSGTMTLTAPYAASNFSGNATVLGESLCGSSCATSPAFGLRNVAPGDILFVGQPTSGVTAYNTCVHLENVSVTECFLVLAVSGTSITMQSSYSKNSTLQAWPSPTYLYLDSQFYNYFISDGGTYYQSFWDYTNFPTGQPFYASVLDLNPPVGHNYQTATGAFGFNTTSVPNCPITRVNWTGSSLHDCYNTRYDPTFFAYVNMPYRQAADNAPFAGIPQGMGDPIGNQAQVDDHPTFDYIAAKPFMYSVKVLNGDNGSPGTPISPCTVITGTKYRCTSAQRGFPDAAHAISFDKTVPVGGFSGPYMAQDVSAPSTTILGTSADNYKYMLVHVAGEGDATSQPGDVIINVPYASLPYSNTGCPDSGCQAGALGNGGNTLDISVIPSGAWTHKIVQNEISGPSPNGERARVLTSFLVPHLYDIYGQTRVLPDNSGFLFQALGNEGWRDPMLFAVNPPAVIDTVNRQSFVMLNESVTPGPGGYVMWEFGYAEFGDPNSGKFYCSPRKENCRTSANWPASGDAFYYAGDTQVPTHVTSTSNVPIPGISGKTLYARLLRCDASGNPVAYGATIHIPVP